MKRKISIYQSKANLDARILVRKSTYILDPEIRKMPVKGIGMRISRSIPIHDSLAIKDET